MNAALAGLALAAALPAAPPPAQPVLKVSVGLVSGDAWRTPGAAVAALVPATRAEVDAALSPTDLTTSADPLAAARVTGATRVVLVSLPRPGHLGGVAIWPGTGLLTSGTTRRAGLLTLDDVHSLARAGYVVPSPGDLTDVHRLDRREHLHERYHGVWATGLIALPMLLYIWLGFGRRRAGFRARRIARVLATYPAAGFVASVVPWWRYEYAGAYAVAAVVAAMAALLAVGTLLARLFDARAEAGIAAAVALAFVVDLITGGHLQETGIASYSAIAGGRFYGLGNVGFGILATSAAVVAGAAARRYGTFAWLWLVPVIVVVALPRYGADFGGALTLTAALVAAFATSAATVAFGLVAGAVVALGVALLDYRRPAAQQTHLGKFVGEVLHGGWTDTISRKASAAAHSLATWYPLLVAGSAAMAWSLLGRFRDARTTRVLVTIWLLGSVVNDTGLVVAAAGMGVAVPLLVSYTDRP